MIQHVWNTQRTYVHTRLFIYIPISHVCVNGRNNLLDKNDSTQ